MKLVFMLSLWMMLMGCMGASDGPFVQTSGRAIDYDALDHLVENKATQSQALAALGEHTEKSKNGDEEVFQYVSTKVRESVSKVGGVRVGSSSQTMEERVTLFFRAGTLVRKEKTSTVR